VHYNLKLVREWGLRLIVHKLQCWLSSLDSRIVARGLLDYERSIVKKNVLLGLAKAFNTHNLV